MLLFQKYDMLLQGREDPVFVSSAVSELFSAAVGALKGRGLI